MQHIFLHRAKADGHLTAAVPFLNCQLFRIFLLFVFPDTEFCSPQTKIQTPQLHCRLKDVKAEFRLKKMKGKEIKNCHVKWGTEDTDVSI